MEVQALIVVGAWGCGLLAKRLFPRKEQGANSEAPSTLVTRNATAWQQDPIDVPHRSKPKPLAKFWTVLIFALLADVPLCYILCNAMIHEQGWNTREVRDRLFIAALPALLAVGFLAARLITKGEAHQADVVVSRDLIHPKVQNFTGTWVKDGRCSDSMSRAIEIVQLNRLTRTAVKLVKGIQVMQTDDTFHLAVFSIIGWFKVRESYPMNGGLSQHKRRDMRRGRHTGRISITEDGCIQLRLEWGEPLGGVGIDEFRLISRNELHVTSQFEIAGQHAKYNTVYRRKQ